MNLHRCVILASDSLKQFCESGHTIDAPKNVIARCKAIKDSCQCLVKMVCGWLVNKAGFCDEMLFTKVVLTCREFTAWDVYFIHFFKWFSMCPQGKQFWRIPGKRWQVPTLSVRMPTTVPHKMVLDVWKYGTLFFKASFVWNSHSVKA